MVGKKPVKKPTKQERELTEAHEKIRTKILQIIAIIVYCLWGFVALQNFLGIKDVGTEYALGFYTFMVILPFTGLMFLFAIVTQIVFRRFDTFTNWLYATVAIVIYISLFSHFIGGKLSFFIMIISILLFDDYRLRKQIKKLK